MTNKQNTAVSHVSAYFMLAFIALSFVATIVTAYNDYKMILPSEYTVNDVVKGRSASLYETEFEDKIIIKDTAIGLWGAISYGFFKTGSKGVIVGADDWLFTTEEFEEYKDGYKEELYKQNLIIQLNTFLKEKDIELIVALLPSKTRIYEGKLGGNIFPQSKKAVYHRFRGELLNAGVNVPNLDKALMDASKKEQVFMQLDTHWTPKAAEIVAQNLADSFQQIADIERMKHVTEYGDKKQYKGDLEKYIPTGIMTKWLSPNSEDVLEHKTVTTEIGGGNDLFSTPVIPVALVGTSYSAIKEWNFAGALKEAFQSDVLNVADEGMGPLEPMANFFKDTDWDNTDIKVVIWEIPERFIPVTYEDVKFSEIKIKK